MQERITLVQASAILGKSYNTTLRLVLTRVIRGEQREGRWYCDAHDVRQFAKKRDAGSAAVTT